MNFHEILACLVLAGLFPVLILLVTLLYYSWLQFISWCNRRPGRRGSRFHACCLALGMAFLQVMWLFYQPSAAFLLEEKQDEDAEEDDKGEPENLKKQLDRQLKKIRRGEPVERLVLRL